MNYEEARNYIKLASKSGMTLGLESMTNLLQELGNPQDDLKFIHIAGTNGKGSVLAYVSTILEISGYQTGRYISPTVQTYRERIQINRTNISKADFCTELATIKKVIQKMVSQGKTQPSVFEIETALGLLHFKNQRCDIVVMETGMGGATDATNVISNTLACIFTTVSRDHMEFLGSSIADLTRAKAGIIKPGAQLICGKLPQEAQKIITSLAQMGGNVLHLPDWESTVVQKAHLPFTQIFSYKQLDAITIQLLGSHQITNAILAIEAIKSLRTFGIDVSDEQVKTGLAATRWFGRVSIIQEANPVIIVDGAHNQEAANALAETLKDLFPSEQIVGVMGVFKDKEIAEMLAAVKAVMNEIHAIALPDQQRTLKVDDLAEHIRQANIEAYIHESLASAMEMATKQADVIVVFGSLSHLGDALKWVKQTERIKQAERGNWQ